MAKISVAGIKKYSIWIGCGLAIVVGSACWYVATGRLTTAYRQNKATVEGKFRAIDARIKNLDNRSDRSIDGVKRDIGDAYQRVKKTWEEIYDHQAKSIFIWPEGLKKDFRDKIKELDDKHVKWHADKATGRAQGDPPPDEIPERLREDYQNFVRGEFRRLLQSIDAYTSDEATASGVRWRDVDRIEQTFNSRQTPSSTWIQLRQEDLWVYTAFCRVIQAVNKGVTGRTAVPLKVIDALEIGDATARSAPAQVGQKRVKRIRTGSSATDSGGGGGGGQQGAGASSSPNADDVLKDRRYVDLKTYRPIPAGELATASAAEFKLIPFRLMVFMDQRDIDRLLVEFRNSVLPIEVLEVRINASAGSASFGDARDPSSSYHIPVELRGVVYIYNPPSVKKPDFIKESETAVAVATPTEIPSDAPTPETLPAQDATPTPEAPPAGPPAVEIPAAAARGTFVSQADGRLKIKTADSDEQELDFADNVQVTIDGAAARLEDLKPDMLVELVKENDRVTAIRAKTTGLEGPAPTP